MAGPRRRQCLPVFGGVAAHVAAGPGAVNIVVFFYDRLVYGLITRGITPWLCLYHWDLPQALQDQGGWLGSAVSLMLPITALVAHRLGDRVKHCAIFNEPNIHALLGYGMGGHAPGLKGLPNMLAASHHQNLAQGRALAPRAAPSAPYLRARDRRSTCSPARPASARGRGPPRRRAVRRVSGTAPSSTRCSRASIRRPLPSTSRR